MITTTQYNEINASPCKTIYFNSFYVKLKIVSPLQYGKQNELFFAYRDTMKKRKLIMRLDYT